VRRGVGNIQQKPKNQRGESEKIKHTQKKKRPCGGAPPGEGGRVWEKKTHKWESEKGGGVGVKERKRRPVA